MRGGLTGYGIGRPVISTEEFDLVLQSNRRVKRRAIGELWHPPNFAFVLAKDVVMEQVSRSTQNINNTSV